MAKEKKRARDHFRNNMHLMSKSGIMRRFSSSQDQTGAIKEGEKKVSPMSCLNTAGFESDRVCVVGFWVWRFSIVGGGGGGGACVSVTKDLDTCFSVQMAKPYYSV